MGAPQTLDDWRAEKARLDRLYLCEVCGEVELDREPLPSCSLCRQRYCSRCEFLDTGVCEGCAGHNEADG